jgi:tRNA threonylcarbamoyladenosine biosynthesis protein TsaB
VKILAVDTALGACSVAVVENDMTLAHRLEPMERGHAERLAPMVRDAMTAAGVGFAAIDRLAVTVGPGTFTGQRVGYAFMRGLRLALKRPLIGITTLEAMAAATQAATGAEAVAVLHDARRNEVYLTVAVGGSVIVPARLAGFEEALETVLEATAPNSRLAIAGTAGQPAADIIAGRGRSCRSVEILYPDALWVAQLALGAPEPGEIPRPLYLRPPDAKLPAPKSE